MFYQIILFDLDNTLIDFTASETMSLHKIYEQFYQGVTSIVFEVLYKEINNVLWKRVGAKENALMPHDIRFLRFKLLNEKIACSGSAQEVADTYDHYLGEYADWIPHVKKAIEFLHQKGHILGIITNGLSNSQGKKRQRLGLHNWFDCFVVSDEVGIAKPNKRIFDIAIEKIASTRNQSIHAYNKNSMLMVGDSMISDGYGAKNFGINYCHVNNGISKHSEETITYHINSVAQLPNCMGYEGEYALYLNSF
ncbi:HAD family hydrolase [Legionella sp.]|uniref:HAD family hydrolase n=1 Tax=Legionella sp. TaxID=459 RepID=UPI003CA6955A